MSDKVQLVSKGDKKWMPDSATDKCMVCGEGQEPRFPLFAIKMFFSPVVSPHPRIRLVWDQTSLPPVRFCGLQEMLRSNEKGNFWLSFLPEIRSAARNSLDRRPGRARLQVVCKRRENGKCRSNCHFSL